MFGLFKKKTELEQLSAQYNELMKQAHALSTQDRTKSDAKHAEAEALIPRIEELKVKEEKSS
ncbi:Lacal_2735 family protein [Reichenbachiella agariperforans]|uniref:Lacal_2735 family protein n=1 Tax=Reichenbachiella agariperforans TaxID=156994 RepID=UPI001C0829A0|nr:Lacal_2735 family protein [Reichenbachiella agariperforans]MBU2914574.1 Lacal_2735 family protein [Reichenbachiella agariperforans]